MEKVKFEDYLNKFAIQLPKGAFLTSRDGDRINTMTIGWGLGGIIWSRPVLTVAVRYSRYTYDLMEASKVFTVSVPHLGQMKKELSFAGTKSGRDFDKFKECNLEKIFCQDSNTPVIKGCEFHFVCKTVHQQSMEPSLIKSDSVKSIYANNHDYHVLYYGEVISTYAE